MSQPTYLTCANCGNDDAWRDLDVLAKEATCDGCGKTAPARGVEIRRIVGAMTIGSLGKKA